MYDIFFALWGGLTANIASCELVLMIITTVMIMSLFELILHITYLIKRW